MNKYPICFAIKPIKLFGYGRFITMFCSFLPRSL